MASTHPDAALPSLAASWLASGDATTLPAHALAADVRYRGDLGTISGAGAYAAARARWASDGHELFRNYRTEVLRCTLLAGTTTVAVRWRASWSPEGVLWLERLAGLCGWRLERFDPPADRVATFSWRAVGALLSTAVSSGVLRLPLSAVEGRSELLIERGVCVAISESVDLVLEARRGKLLNRRVAQELAAFLDVCRRPEDIDPDDWAATVRTSCLSGVPGAGVLDVDPSEDGPAAVGVFALGTASLLAASIGALGRETGVFGSTICDEVAGAASEGWFSQCVSDLIAQ